MTDVRPVITEPTLCPDCVRLKALCLPTPRDQAQTSHTGQLRYLLGEVHPTLSDLTEAFARQTRIGEQVRAASGEVPLPFDQRASEAADLLLGGTVVKWADRIRKANPATAAQDDPVVYLVTHLPGIRRHAWSAQLFVDLHRALEKAWRTVDLAEEYLEAGSCDCGKRLQARPGSPTVTCQTCARQYDVADRRAQMLAYAECLWLPAADIERMVNIFVRLGERDRIRRRLDATLVRKWGERREVPSTVLDGKTCYRLGDVLDRGVRGTVASGTTNGAAA